MRLLIITQKVDRDDTVLSFFHGWIREFAKKFESIVVICLYRGDFDLPDNVTVLSLGKEKWRSKLKYIFLLFYFSIRYFNRYDAVLVHMNEEYVVLAGWLWRIIGKKVYLWRNHHAGNRITDVASVFCNKVFCTSKYSYTIKYKKTILMPVGIDLEKFVTDVTISRRPRSVLYLGRIAPSKNVHLFVEALILMKDRGIEFSANIFGDALPKDQQYLDTLKKRVHELGLANDVIFHAGVSNVNTPVIYSAHQIFVNLSSSGMYDKTIFEAMACGCLVLASNDNLSRQIDDNFIFKYGDTEEFLVKIDRLLNYGPENIKEASVSLMKFVKKHSLVNLTAELFNNIE